MAGLPKGLPGPISQILTERAFQPKKDDPEMRSRIEVVADTIISEAEKGDIRAQRILFEYIQGKASPTLTEEQAILMAINVTPERKAQLASMGVADIHEREKKFLAEVNINGTRKA